MCSDAMVCKMQTGLELIWPTLMQINFWNLETGQERKALQSVSPAFCFHLKL